MSASMTRVDNKVSGGSGRGFGIYIHLPFCTHRCSYCDFFSSAKFTDSAFDEVARAVCWEIRAQGNQWRMERGDAPRPTVDSIFLGGGTPSLFAPKLIESIFETLRSEFPWGQGAEITMEANPETLSPEYLRAIRASTPVNRISMGAQSFAAKHLNTLERLCSPDQVRRAAGWVQDAGFDRFNLDLIFAIPDQTLAEIESDARSAAALGPGHISFYQLTLGSKHKLYDRLPDEDLQTDGYMLGAEVLESLGYGCYEISNFAKPGHKCAHNLLYWTGGDFLGVGPSASSRVFRNGVFHHRKQIADLAKYLRQPTPPAWEPTTAQQTILEASFLELRTDMGVQVDDFARRYRFNLRTAKKLPAFKDAGLVEDDGTMLRLTAKGRLLADGISRDLADY